MKSHASSHVPTLPSKIDLSTATSIHEQKKLLELSLESSDSVSQELQKVLS